MSHIKDQQREINW